MTDPEAFPEDRVMEHDVEGQIGAGWYERGDGRQTWRNDYPDRELKTRLGRCTCGRRSSGGVQTSPAFSIRGELR